MPKYPTPPDLAAIVRNHERRIRALEVKVANLGSQPVGTPGNVFDANVLWNGGFESGLTGWQTSFFTGTAGALGVDGADPLDGLYSGRVVEGSSGRSRRCCGPRSRPPTRRSTRSAALPRTIASACSARRPTSPPPTCR